MPQIFHPKILAIQHLDGISDHKLVLLNLNLENLIHGVTIFGNLAILYEN